MKRLTAFITFLLLSPLCSAQFFSYEVIEGKEYFEAGVIHCQIEYTKQVDKTIAKLHIMLPRNSKIPTEVLESNSTYIGCQFKITQGSSVLYQENKSHYTSIRDDVYKSDLKYIYQAFKDPYVIQAVGRFSKFNYSKGYGDELFRIKLKVKPVYFGSYDGNVKVDPSVNERYVMDVSTKTYYYPKLSNAVKIYVERNGKALSKPTGYLEKEFKLVTKYIYKGKTIHTQSLLGSSLQTPFFHHDKNDDYYIKLKDKGLFISSNEDFPPGNASITIVSEVLKNGQQVFKESKQVTFTIPTFKSHTFRLTGAQLLPDGEKMFKHNSKWNNQGRDPLPDLVCKVKIGEYELGATDETSDSFSTEKSTTIVLNYIEGKPVNMVFYLIDKDAFLNPDDVLVKIEQDITTFLRQKPTKITDNYLGSFSIIH